MYNRLLIAALATAFSINNFAAETPAINHSKELQTLLTRCEDSDAVSQCPFMSKRCPKLKALLAQVELRQKETDTLEFTPAEMKRIEKYSAASKSTHSTIPGISEAAPQDTDEVSEKIADELNIKPEPQE